MTTSQDDGNMIDNLVRFNLSEVLSAAEQQKPWPSGHYARMLYKKPDLRLVLIGLEKSAQMKEHHADGTISIQVLKGHLKLTAEGSTQDLPTGSLLTLAASIKHTVEAVDDSAFLLTIAWPSNEELLAMKHRGYGT